MAVHEVGALPPHPTLTGLLPKRVERTIGITSMAYDRNPWLGSNTLQRQVGMRTKC